MRPLSRMSLHRVSFLGVGISFKASIRYPDRMTTSAPPDLFRDSPSLDALNALSRDTAIETLGIVFTEVGHDFIRATMPVDARSRQPYGLLHGGASVLLAETLGSSAGNLCVGPGEMCVGVEINANHLVAVRDGHVTGTARPLHIGRRTQVWEIRIEDPLGRLCCISRLTLAVVARRHD
jgi:1,4-dihydroxy-2-naphthoyl-CoA hydrolase